MKSSKPIKKKETEHRSTVTELHSKKVDEFLNYYKTLPEKKVLLSTKKKSLSEIDKNDWKQVSLYMDLDNEIKELLKEIEDMESQSGLSKYLLDANQILLKISENSYKTRDSDKYQNNNITNFVSFKGVQTRGSLMDEYLEKTGQGVFNRNKKDEDFICKICNSYMKVNDSESMIVCEECGITRHYTDTTNEEWTDRVEIVTPYSYKRHNHFEDHIRRFQAKESKNIPRPIVDSIILELKKRQITNTNDLNASLIKSILKKLDITSYYDNINRIICILTGKKPPKMSKELEEKLRVMFNIIQEPFEKHKSKCPYRTNFLSYSYTINKMLRIIGENEPEALEFLPSFKLLKSREKLIMQDKIWKAITEEVGWGYKPSV